LIPDSIRGLGLLEIVFSLDKEIVCVLVIFFPEREVAGFTSTRVSHSLQEGQHPNHFGVL